MKNTAPFIVRFIVLLMIVMIAGSLGTCKKQPSGRTELWVLNYYDTSTVHAAGEITLVWEAFERANPDIKIIREDAFNDPFHNKVDSYVREGRIPDVMYAWPSGRSTELHARGLLKNLGPLVQRDNLSSLYSATALDPSGQASGYLGILPQAITATNAFYINLAVLDACGLEPAKTYGELRAQVPILKARGYETVLMANADSWVMQSCLFSLVAGRFCGKGWEQRILSGGSAFTDPGFVAALDFIKTLYDDGVLSKTALSTGYAEVAEQFAAHRGAYLIDGDWRVAAFVTGKSTGQALIPVEAQRNILISVFPEIEGALLNRSNSVVLGTGWGISAAIPPGSVKEEAAWRLVKWLSGKEVQEWLLETGGIAIPTRTDIDVGSLRLEPMQVAVGNLGKEYDVSTAVIDGAFDEAVYTPINEGLQAIGMGTRTPRQAAQAIQSAFEAWRAQR
ncbi:MAG: extracellular solute-binding protein [Spirochaetaceae bacterium]|jgi:raffinose/stachyose/melibiose transport system substrate-binding protein|nr:extracellular solute-binding protein [Spirochaetaceae bacterium]